MKKVIFGLSLLCSFMLSANNITFIEEKQLTCGEWAADLLEVIEEESGCMSADEYNADWVSLVNYCYDNM